ncbi:hypothetical protein OIO90_001905 [Microbotryomycetes sp. JL221]|nr:hypothetical protein OIO90_001905 [Microbotryomycetes sp. JL221]
MSVQHSPRPSPTKRSLSSPDARGVRASPSDRSPRAGRTKFTSSLLVNGADNHLVKSEQARVSTTEEGPELNHNDTLVASVTTTPPSPVVVEPVVGLGFAVGPSKDLAADSPAATAVEQQRRLESLPSDLHVALARLSSQHHQSEYNRMKIALHQPANFAPRSHMVVDAPLTAPPLNRSHSSPPLGISSIPQPQPPPHKQETAIPRHLMTNVQPLQPRPSSMSFASGWPSLIRPVIDLAAAAASAATSALGSPSSSRPVTPMESFLTPNRSSTLEHRTGLTPELRGLSCESGSLTPIEPRGQFSSQGSQQGAAAADVLRHALENTLARAEAPSAIAITQDNAASTLSSKDQVVTKVGGEPFIAGMKMINGIAVRTSVSHPINISHLVPPQMMLHFSDSVNCQRSSSDSHALSNVVSGSQLRFERPSDADLWDIVAGSASSERALPTASAILEAVSPGSTASTKIGNFMLSSCPGKKVRLEATAIRSSSRSAICRDVNVDLGRAQSQGVKLVICCLDDQELAFLGSPIEEYVQAVDELGLKMVRIPMVEGFAPTSPEELDQQLDVVIKECTLQGADVLAHCRGGIGRAGLVACCWLIKMGIVGGDASELINENPMRVVERVIDVIRRRRSIKAIETPVQVSFLLSYVAYLQDQTRIAKALTSNE